MNRLTKVALMGAMTLGLVAGPVSPAHALSGDSRPPSEGRGCRYLDGRTIPGSWGWVEMIQCGASGTVYTNVRSYVGAQYLQAWTDRWGSPYWGTTVPARRATSVTTNMVGYFGASNGAVSSMGCVAGHCVNVDRWLW